MLRPVMHDSIWAFDAEWVPDPATGRRVLDLPGDMPDEEVVERMWAQGGATEAEPRPYLKTILCRVVSIAVVIRHQEEGSPEVHHRLFALPEGTTPLPEDELLRRFLIKLGDGNRNGRKPQLVGFNSRDADLPILAQRAMVHRLSIPGLGRSGEKWAKDDFFDRYGTQHVDLREASGAWGKAGSTLHELATACGIPGKLGTDGKSVIDLWRAGDVAGIVRYNQFDALTTFLVWLRAMTLSGHLSPEQMAAEEASIRSLVEQKALQDPGFSAYLAGWDRLAGKPT